ncbi:MAG: ribonuclease H-like domain-containing protein [Methanosarcinales archaeon]|nr:ribonuclease H-like domain-containing protein [Methanosarcinales archaeon]
MSPRRLGLTRGLKRIETQLGLSRSDETTGLSGFDAVRLWYRYKRGSQAALDKLVRYNIEDIQNLETIIEMLYASLMENTYQ